MPSSGDLFLTVSQALLSELICEGAELGRKCPAILRSIGNDQDRPGLAEKELRAEHAARRAHQTPCRRSRSE